MDSINTAILWLLSVLKRNEDHVLIMHFSLVTGSIISFSVFMFLSLSDQKVLFLAACQLGVAAFISPLAIRFPFLRLPSFLAMGGGKAHIFPLSYSKAALQGNT